MLTSSTDSMSPAVRRNSQLPAFIALCALLLLAATYLFWDVRRPFNQTDEFLYATVAENMLSSGDFVTPRFAHIELFTKPPLFYWLSAGMLAVSGDHQLSVRLIPGASLLALMVLVFEVGRRYFNSSVGLLSAAILFLCYDHLFNHTYKAGVMEGLLNLLIAGSVFLNVTLFRNPGNVRWIAILVGLAFLTKSVFAAIPCALTLVNLVANRDLIRISRRHWIQSAALVFVVVLPWFLAVVSTHGARVLDYMFVDQVWRRAINDAGAAAATGRTFGRREDFYVLRHFLEYGHPWSMIVWPALWHAVRSSRNSAPQQKALLLLCVYWFAGVMLLFLISRGRWSWYISSVYIPAALLIACLLYDFLKRPEIRVGPFLWIALITSMLVTATPYVFDPYERSSGAFPLTPDLSRQLLVVGLIVLVTVAFWRRPVHTRAELGVLPFVVAIPVLTTALVAFYAYSARDPSRAVMLPVHVVLGFLLAGAGMAGLMCLRANWQARAAAVVCVFVIAIGYVVAPLHRSAAAPERREVTWVRGAIASGWFDREEELKMRGASLFSFIPVYAVFRHEYVVEYDAERRTILVKSMARASDSIKE